jgi:hypothetical protein
MTGVIACNGGRDATEFLSQDIDIKTHIPKYSPH